MRWAAIVLGTVVSAYLTAVHYYQPVPLVCGHYGIVDCQSVLTSGEAVWMGIPVSAYGLGWFLLYALFMRVRGSQPWLLRGWVLLATAVVCYLVYVEFVILQGLCLWCSLLHIAILTLLAIELREWAVSAERER